MSATNDVVMPNELSALCRVCLLLPDEVDYLDLTTIYDEDDNLTYGECFTICTQIDLSDGDNIPHNLCRQCGLELQMSYDFYKKVEESKRTLEQYKQEIEQDYRKPQEAIGTLPIGKELTELKDVVTKLEVESTQFGVPNNDCINDEELVDMTLIGKETLNECNEVEDFIAISQNSERSGIIDMLSEYGEVTESVDNDDLDHAGDDAAADHCVLDQDDNDSLVSEEHLDLNEFHIIETLEDEEAETLQIKSEENILPLATLLEIEANGKYIFEEIEQTVDEVERAVIDQGQTQTQLQSQTQSQTQSPSQSQAAKSKEDCRKWQENVVTVANKEHLPLEADADTKSNNGSLEYEILHSNDECDVEDDNKMPLPRTGQPRKRRIGAYTCEYCLKVYPNYSRMINHRRCHEADRPKYPCEFCSRIYTTKQAMECHIQTEHEKTGFACTVCSKVFAIRRSLEVHMRFHNGDFPYECNLCEKKFAQLCHLNTHKNVKHNNVRFACDYPECGKFFTSSTSLRNHEYSHGVMPFECEYCQRGYPAKAKLKIHIKRKHGLDLSKEQLENMRKFHVMRSKVNLVRVINVEEEISGTDTRIESTKVDNFKYDVEF